MTTVRVERVEPARIADLRRSVLRPNLAAGTPYDPVDADDAVHAVHLGAVDESGEVVGTCVVFPASYPLRPGVEPAWQLRAMAVAPHAQGTGVGNAVLTTAIETATAAGAVLLWCNARTTAVPFYARHGFVTDGPEFISAPTGLPHYAMWRELSGAPATSSG